MTSPKRKARKPIGKQASEWTFADEKLLAWLEANLPTRQQGNNQAPANGRTRLKLASALKIPATSISRIYRRKRRIYASELFAIVGFFGCEPPQIDGSEALKPYRSLRRKK